MSRLLYSDDVGAYRMIDFNQSHNELLFRKHKSNAGDANIDLLFKGVYSLNIATTYKGISILLVDRAEGNTCSNAAERDFIFKLLDNVGLETYIDASACGVFSNQLEFGVSSLGDFTWSDDNKCLSWFTEKENLPGS